MSRSVSFISERPQYFLRSIGLGQGYSTCGIHCIGSHPFCCWHIFCYRTMRFTALFFLSASATGAAFVPPTGYGASVPHGESALAAKRDLLRSIFRRPSRLAAKVSSVLFFYLCPSLARASYVARGTHISHFFFLFFCRREDRDMARPSITSPRQLETRRLSGSTDLPPMA